MEKHNKKCEECRNIFITNEKPGMNKKYCSNKCYLKNKSGQKNGNWKGGNTKKCPICKIVFSKYTKSCGKKCGDVLRKINSSKANLGKTKKDTTYLMKMSIERSGKKRSKKICKNISKGTIDWLTKTNFNAKYKYKSYNMRSNWERLVANFLDLNDIKWKYEPTKIYLKSINTWYLPDFYIPEWDTFIEVKGFATNRTLRKYYAYKKEFGNIIKITEKEMKEFGLI